LTTESGSVTGILESYTADSLKEKPSSLDALLKAVDERSKQPIVFSKFSNKASNNPKHFCADCGKRLKTHRAVRCASCNMRIVGKNHTETRKNKGRPL
jgi:DNA-directed RNA polymerase subunit RPC12/RpoP